MAERAGTNTCHLQALEELTVSPMAIIGAGGYVGSRLIEQSVLLGNIPIRPIVRSWRSQGRLARYGTCTVRGDASDPKSLVPLLQGCGVAVNLTMGNNTRMLADVQSIHAACAEAGVGLFVHISSAEVFGRAEVDGLKEDSIPDANHWMEYARAKIEAEAWLRSQSTGRVQVIVLRPGLIWGPGGGWLVGSAQALVDGSAFLINEGSGICNLIHVDNLISHLKTLGESPGRRSAFYNVSDPHTLTWLEYYSAIAHEIGVNVSTIHRVPESAYQESWRTRFSGLGQLELARSIKKRMSGATKIRLKQQLKDLLNPPSNLPEPVRNTPIISKELWWIQGTRSKLPTGRFQIEIGRPVLKEFPELMRAAGHWLRYAGFEVADKTPTTIVASGH